MITEDTKVLIKRLIRENLPTITKKKRFITESVLNGKTIINVDIQPEYGDYITFDVKSWVNFINKSSKANKIIFLYNGEDTMGMVNEHDYKIWLLDHGIKESVIINSRFYDKGYAFFRYCMDSGIDERNVADLVKFMSLHDINDSRMIDGEMWNKYMTETNHDQTDVRELLENADDMVSIPDLMDFLKNFNNIVLTGGGINECLKEVEIALLALEKPFNILTQYTY